MRVLTEQGDPNCRFSPFSRIFEEFGEIFKTFIAVLGKILIPLGQILMPRNKCRMLNKSIWSHWFEATFGIKSRKHFNKLFLRVSPQDTPILSLWVIYYLYFSSSSSLCRSKFVSFCFISNFYLFWLGHSQPLFSFYLSFQCSLQKIKFAHNWIQTADQCCRKQLLYQLSHNHWLPILYTFVNAREQCDQKKSPNVYKSCPKMSSLEKW